MRIALDFDGVLCSASGSREMGEPLPGALDAVRSLRAAGHDVIVFTVRAGAKDGGEHVYDWLEYFGFPPMVVTDKKLPCTVYIDNHGYHFENWADTLDYLGLGHGDL